MAAFVIASPLRAQADAWSTAKAHLPADTGVVAGMNVPAVTGSTVFQSMWPLAMMKYRDVKKALESIKRHCKIDPLAAVKTAVLGATPDQGEGAVYLELGGGLDEAKLVACFGAVARAEVGKDATVGVSKDGAITELALGSEKAYVAWLGNVLVMTTETDKKASLHKWIGGKGAFARSPAGKLASRVRASDAMWAVSGARKDLPGGLDLRGGHGALRFAGSNATAELRLVLPSEKDARGTVQRANSELGSAAAGLDANLAAVLKQVQLSSQGPEVTVKATIPQAQLLELIMAIAMR